MIGWIFHQKLMRCRLRVSFFLSSSRHPPDDGSSCLRPTDRAPPLCNGTRPLRPAHATATPLRAPPSRTPTRPVAPNPSTTIRTCCLLPLTRRLRLPSSSCHSIPTPRLPSYSPLHVLRLPLRHTHTNNPSLRTSSSADPFFFTSLANSWTPPLNASTKYKRATFWGDVGDHSRAVSPHAIHSSPCRTPFFFPSSRTSIFLDGHAHRAPHPIPSSHLPSVFPFCILFYPPFACLGIESPRLRMWIWDYPIPGRRARLEHTSCSEVPSCACSGTGKLSLGATLAARLLSAMYGVTRGSHLMPFMLRYSKTRRAGRTDRTTRTHYTSFLPHLISPALLLAYPGALDK
ncbi:hypothetical protein C8J57DRAFT_1523859 [Mycena rebaudengoi]|nr:hypothetical protein C8J57DRAFT_1523859 [Mycena rebaudengoi]